MNQSVYLEVSFLYSPIINFALQQNHVPVVRNLGIKNISRADISNVGIEITCNPEFAIPWAKRIDVLPMDELVEIGAIDIKSLTKYLAELSERLVGDFTLVIRVGE